MVSAQLYANMVLSGRPMLPLRSQTLRVGSKALHYFGYARSKNTALGFLATCLPLNILLVCTLVVCTLDRFLIQSRLRTGTGCGAPETCHMRTCCKRRRCCHEAGEPAGFCGAGGAGAEHTTDEIACLLWQCPYSCIAHMQGSLRCCAASRPHPWRLWCVPPAHTVPKA